MEVLKVWLQCGMRLTCLPSDRCSCVCVSSSFLAWSDPPWRVGQYGTALGAVRDNVIVLWAHTASVLYLHGVCVWWAESHGAREESEPEEGLTGERVELFPSDWLVFHQV